MYALVPLLIALLLAPLQVGAQSPDEPELRRLTLLGSIDEDRLRLGQLLGDAPADGFLLRSPSSLLLRSDEAAPAAVSGPVRWAVLAPELHTVRNSALPHSLNEGPLRAGRGLNARMTLGLEAGWRDLTLVLAPQLVYEENRTFQTFSYPEIGRTRHPLASPFHYPPGSMDLPQRFGWSSRVVADAGQSSLTLESGRVAVGAASENQWWGPGIRNALLMSAHAPGIPHLFLRTARPVETRIGAIDARWMIGRLSGSGYFLLDDASEDADGNGERHRSVRSLSALAVTLSPAFDPNLTVGLARAVYAPADDGWDVLGSAFDAVRSVGRPSSAPGDTLLAPGRDQLFTLFARWAFPGAGLEAYGEWGRWEQPANLRDFLEVPNHSRGYTMGVQFARPWSALGTFRLQAEASNLEPSTSYRVRPFGEWYASRRVPEGYTHRGQVIGAAIGPSGSNVWLAGDVFADRWHAGVFGSWVRWENEAQHSYIQEYRRSDVSLIAGLRGGGEVGPLRVTAEYARTARLNYLFQALPPEGPGEGRGVDIINHTLKVTLSTGSGVSVPRFLQPSR